MGNGILSRSGSGDGAKIGDIRLTTKDSIGAKWALCNGDVVNGDSPIVNLCSFDPTDSSHWYDLGNTVVIDHPAIMLYDPTDNVYWGICITNPTSTSASKTVGIYRYDRNEQGQYQYVVNSYSLGAAYILYDACFIHDEVNGNKIAFAYGLDHGVKYIAYYHINTGNCGFDNTSYRITLNSAYDFEEVVSFDTTSTTNGGNTLRIASAGKYLILADSANQNLYTFDSNSMAQTSIDMCDFGETSVECILSYASGPHHTALICYEYTEGYNYVAIVDNNTGKFKFYDYDYNISGAKMGVHISCIYEESEDKEYFIHYLHDDGSVVYRGMTVVTASGSANMTKSSITNTNLFGINSRYFGSYYEFKMNGSYYAMVMNTSGGQYVYTLNGKIGTVSSRNAITLGGIYNADRNIFGYKTGAPWYMLSSRYNGDVYFTVPCLPDIQEGAYNGFIKVEN